MYARRVSARPCRPLLSNTSCLRARVVEHRVWDRIVGGSAFVEIFTGVSVLLTLRPQLMAMKSDAEVQRLMQRLPESFSEQIIGKAIELWQSSVPPRSADR